MRTRPIGSLVGAIAGLIFVFVNAGAIPASRVWQITAVVGFAAVAWFVVLRGPEVEQVSWGRTALRTYAISLAAMVVAIPTGAAIVNNVLDKPSAVPVWVVFVVGAHFWPFARAFQMPIFGWLSVSLVLVSIAGVIPTLASSSTTAAGWTGVVAGFVLLTFSAIGPRLATPATTRPHT